MTAAAQSGNSDARIPSRAALADRVASLRSFREFQVWWKANKDNFFVPSYSQGVKSAIYYFKKFDTDMSGQLDLSEFGLVRASSFERAFSQSSAF